MADRTGAERYRSMRKQMSFAAVCVVTISV